MRRTAAVALTLGLATSGLATGALGVGAGAAQGLPVPSMTRALVISTSGVVGVTVMESLPKQLARPVGIRLILAPAPPLGQGRRRDVLSGAPLPTTSSVYSSDRDDRGQVDGDAA